MISLVQLQATGIQHSNLGVVGSVEDVIAGRVRDDLRTRKLLAKDYRFGFEIGSAHGLQSLGESVLVNGHCYTTSTDPQDHYLQTISGNSFYTSGIFLVPHTAQASYHLRPMRDAVGVAYQDFCHSIHEETQGPCLVAALVRFKHLEATYIQKAPIHGENIFEHKETYYGDLKLQFDDCCCFLVSTMANFYVDPKAVLEQLKVVLYQNPFDVKNELNIHTHGIVLNRELRDVSLLLPRDVTHTLHFYNENTVVSEVLWGEVFVIHQIEAL
ncbi:MAG: hypothetical protein Q8R79_00175 [Legionellaceae bacterium]|nr:hypothetical protein [Legionellaceae bacterium]